MQSAKIINDPVFGFIRVPRGLLFDIVHHPAFYRLSRIKQLGGANIVYPGAQHTRFQHSLGAFHLMTKAIQSLQMKGNFIFDSEAEAVEAAILLHDVGHGPFSHVLEHTLISGINHEDISLMMMEQMNEEMRGQLSLAIKIFKDEYPKHFLHQLISSQLDIDRLDYLKRDAFFAGVKEANIGSTRIIDMLDIVDGQLAVDKKGIYSIENYLFNRRLMYWQVYLHKTSVAAEHVMINALRRAKQLCKQGETLFASPALAFFLTHDIDRQAFMQAPECLTNYLALDDNDIWTAMKVWSTHPDPILSMLSSDFIHRNIFKVEVSDEPFPQDYIEEKRNELSVRYNVAKDEAHYLTALVAVGRDMYSLDDDQIEILFSDGTIQDITEASDMFSTSLAAKKVRKYYFCYQR